MASKILGTEIGSISKFNGTAIGSLSKVLGGGANFSGTLDDGETCTITGVGFGATGPNIILFSDFEEAGKVNGNEIGTGEGSAQIGHWDYAGPDDQSTYSNSYAHSGSLSWASDWWCPTCNEEDGPEISRQLNSTSLGSGTREIYISMWEFIPTGFRCPGSSYDGGNWKRLWVWDDSAYWAASDQWFCFIGEANPWSMSGMYCAHGCSGDGGDCTGRFSSQALDEWDWKPALATNQWSRWEFYLKGSMGVDGKYTMWDMNASNSRYVVVDRTQRTLASEDHYWDTIAISAFARAEPNSDTSHYAIDYQDDIYISIGSGARARVEVGNNVTYSSCTNLAVCTVDSWSDTEIDFTVRSGSFSSGTVYLHVIDSSGAVVWTSGALTWGSTY